MSVEFTWQSIGFLIRRTVFFENGKRPSIESMTEPSDQHPKLKPQRKIAEKLALSSSRKTAILSPIPCLHCIALGNSITELSKELKTDPQIQGDYSTVSEDLDEYQKANQFFIEEKSLNAFTCSQSVKRWAFERLSPLKLAYEIKNRLNSKQDNENADPHASRRLLELAEDFFEISSFCREIKALEIAMEPHAAGMGFIFEFHGARDRQETRVIEDKGLTVLFAKYSRENSMRLRANISDEFVEIQVVVFRKQLRLGMSPSE